MRSLPGSLDQIPMFNSNSPEWIKQGGILLSTFPPEGKKTPTAHLNYAFQGEFTLFAHHFTHTPKDLQTLYIGILAHNPSNQPITIEIPAAASYQLEPDAPFKTQPMMLENPTGEIFSGPGIRAVDAVLRGQRTPEFAAKVVIPAKGYQLLMNAPIPTKGLARPVNGRSSFAHVKSSDKVYLASLAMFAPKNAQGSDRPPTLAEWRNLLDTGTLAMPRDKTPTPLDQTSGPLIYSRVAGVQIGSTWQAKLTDSGQTTLALPRSGQTLSYPISTLRRGRLGTSQIQAAPLVVRYPDTAYESHGNYCVRYDLTMPLVNRSDRAQTVAITLATPLKDDQLAQGKIRFRQPPQDFPYFRGTVRLRYQEDTGKAVTRYIHLWQRTGQKVDPLVTLKLKPKEQRSVRLDFLYPPDVTPPQVLMITTQ
ncbi:DUF3370 domain-containing protein [Alkalinema pantanalense CENA528]|uniref:DUF3370 domain-containing protein n=1 Tax=Alkalinema pantanalense TaxID=1620705 RepID=UPI003D6FBBE1